MISQKDFYLSKRPQAPGLAPEASTILPEKSDPLIAQAVRDGVAEALRAAGLTRPTPVLPKGGVMTDAFIDKFQFILKEGDAPSAMAPYTRKRPQGDFQCTWPEGYLGYPIAKAQGRTQLIAENRLRKKLKKLKRYDGDEKPTKQQERWLDAIYRIAREVKFFINWEELFRNGLNIAITKRTEGLTNDVAEDGFAEGRRKLTTLAMAKDWFFDDGIPDPAVPSECSIPQSQRQNLEPVIKELVKELKPETLLIDVVRNTTKFNKWYRKNVIEENKRWKYSTRQARAATVSRFFRDVCKQFDCPEIKTRIFTHPIQGQAPGVSAPSPEIIKKMLLLIYEERPELLLYALYQVFFALRPEEAYRGLLNPAECFDVDIFFFAKEKAKRQTKLDRWFLVIPAAKAWFARIPNLLTRLDHRPQKDGEVIPPDELQKQLNEFLVRAGFNEKIPKEALRKSRLSAGFACGTSWADLMAEAAHINPDMLDRYIDTKWKKARGMALFSIFPPGESRESYTDDQLYQFYAKKHPIQQQRHVSPSP
jgi:integrase